MVFDIVILVARSANFIVVLLFTAINNAGCNREVRAELPRNELLHIF